MEQRWIYRILGENLEFRAKTPNFEVYDFGCVCACGREVNCFFPQRCLSHQLQLQGGVKHG